MKVSPMLLIKEKVSKMEEQLISFETAKLAIEKKCKLIKNDTYYASFSRFNDASTFCKNYDNMLSYDIIDGQDNEGSVYNCLITLNTYESLPTQSLLLKWLREVHNLHITISVFGLNYYYYSTSSINNKVGNCIQVKVDGIQEDKFFTTYEEALELGLVEALNLLNIN